MLLLSSIASVESFLWYFLDRGLASLFVVFFMDPVTCLGYLIGTFSVDSFYFSHIPSGVQWQVVGNLDKQLDLVSIYKEDNLGREDGFVVVQELYDSYVRSGTHPILEGDEEHMQLESIKCQ